MFKDIVDINYRATDDFQTMYRALHITQVSPNITGRYFCKVSGDRNEALVSKKLVVYGEWLRHVPHLVTLRLAHTKSWCATFIAEPPEDGLNLEHDEDNNTIVCSSNGVLPAPELTLCIVDM